MIQQWEREQLARIQEVINLAKARLKEIAEDENQSKRERKIAQKALEQCHKMSQNVP